MLRFISEHERREGKKRYRRTTTEARYRYRYLTYDQVGTTIIMMVRMTCQISLHSSGALFFHVLIRLLFLYKRQKNMKRKGD